MIWYFWQGFILGFPASTIPGPLQAFLLAQTVRKGIGRTLPAALAPLISDGPIITLVLLILTQLSATMLAVLQLVGGVFLLYLGWGAFQLWRNYVPLNQAKGSQRDQTVWKAALINLLNPNPYIFWSTVGGVKLLEAWREGVGEAVGFMLGMYLTLCGGFALFVVVVGLVGQVDGEEGKFGRILILISVLALLGFGLFQIITALP